MDFRKFITIIAAIIAGRMKGKNAVKTYALFLSYPDQDQGYAGKS